MSIGTGRNFCVGKTGYKKCRDTVPFLINHPIDQITRILNRIMYCRALLGQKANITKFVTPPQPTSLNFWNFWSVFRQYYTSVDMCKTSQLINPLYVLTHLYLRIPYDRSLYPYISCQLLYCIVGQICHFFDI
jgi:hypothetical protein